MTRHQQGVFQVSFCRKASVVCVVKINAGADLGGGCRGCAPPWDDLRFSNITGTLQKNYVVYWCWSRARDECTPSKKKSWICPCSVSCFIRLNARTLYHFVQLTKKDRMLWLCRCTIPLLSNLASLQILLFKAFFQAVSMQFFLNYVVHNKSRWKPWKSL